MTETTLCENLARVMPGVRADLEDLVRIPSVWADPARRHEVQRSAGQVAELQRASRRSTSWPKAVRPQ